MYIVRTLTIIIIIYSGLLAASIGEPRNYYHPFSEDFLQEVEKYHLQSGIDKVKKGQFEYAWNEFAYMLHYFPNHPKALQLISDLGLQMEEKERPLKYFERATKLYPNEAQTFALYGQFLQKIGLPTQAISQYQQAISLDHESAEYYYHLGLAYLAIKDHHNANLAAQKAYQRGYTLPGLKDQLIAQGKWQTDLTHQLG